MNSEKVNNWLQVVGMFGIMASLVFVGFQVRQTQAIGEGESAAHFLETVVSARQIFIDNADVWIRGCMGEDMSAVDEAKFAHLFRAYSQGSFFAWLGSRNNILELNPQDVVYSFAANIHRYPGLAQTNLSFRRGWAVEGMNRNLESGIVFGNAIRARIAELQKIDPDPKYDVKWCGM